MRFQIIVAITCLLAGCDSSHSFNLAKETSDIMELHRMQRHYHFEKDSIAFAAQLRENHISVNRGIISQPSREDLIAKYHDYFSAVEFKKWDDVQPPIIVFSEDGTMAYTIVDKIVEVAYNDSDGDETTGQTHFAWVAIYTKKNGEWKIDCVASSNQPE